MAPPFANTLGMAGLTGSVWSAKMAPAALGPEAVAELGDGMLTLSVCDACTCKFAGGAKSAPAGSVASPCVDGAAPADSFVAP